MLVKTFGSAVYGVEAIAITIEVNIGGGDLKYFIVILKYYLSSINVHFIVTILCK